MRCQWDGNQAMIFQDGKRVGELTSVCRSAIAGAIGLGYVRVSGDAPGTAVRVGDVPARVAALPFVSPGSTPAP